MTVREAVGILAAVSQQFRAAKYLEEALRVGVSIESIVKSKTEEAEALDVEIAKKKGEDHALYREYKDKTRIIAKLVDAEKNAREGVLQAGIDSKKALEVLKRKEGEALKKQKKTHFAQLKALEDKIQERKEELDSVETKIRIAEKALNIIKEKLG